MLQIYTLPFFGFLERRALARAGGWPTAVCGKRAALDGIPDQYWYFRAMCRRGLGTIIWDGWS